MKNVTIKVKLIGGIVFFLLLAFVVLTLANYYLSKNEIIERIEKHELPTYAQNVKNEIFIKIADGVMPLHVMINDSKFKSFTHKNINRTEEILAYLKRISEKHNVIIGFISDKSGRYFSSTGNSRQITRKKEAWYYAFLESEKKENFNLGRSADTQKVSLFLSKKIYDDNENFTGVAYIGLNFSNVEDLVLSKKFGEKSNIMMLNNTGNIIISRDSSLLNIDNAKSNGKNIKSIDGLADISDTLLAQKDVTKKYTDKNGQEKIAISLYLDQLDAHLLMEVSSKELTRPARVILFKTLMISFLFFAAILLFMIILVRRAILEPIQNIIASSGEFTKGNLSNPIKYKSNDELGVLADNLEIMRERLLQMIKATIAGSEAIQSAGNEIKQSSLSLAKGSETQAVGVEELLASMENIQVTISKFVNVSKESEEVAGKSRLSIEKVKGSFDDTLKTLNNIKAKIAQIQDIAFTTNILSINSSIEASRAGEAGKGFSVVAGEVNDLAAKSASVAKEVDEFTQNSFEVAQKSLLLLNELIPLVNQISESMQKVSETSLEQKQNYQKITGAIQELSSIAQQNVSTAEELSNTSSVFFKQANRFKEHTSFFDVGNR
jgi:methyl-accepting chemotaxis protein